MKITRLALTNFQDHNSSTIEFSPTFNCITGPTNSGKSAIARALSFLFYGDWIEDYITHTASHSELELSFDNNTKIKRIKSKDTNTIIFTKDGKELEPLTKVGRKLPAEFYNLSGLSPVSLDFDREIRLNISEQDDPYFLLTETGPTKTKILGKLAGLHVVDAAIRGLQTDKKKLSLEKGQRSQDLEQLKKELADSVVLEQYQKAITNASAAFNVVKKFVEKQKQLTHLQTRYSTIIDQLALLDKAIQSINSASFDETALTRLETGVQQLKVLENHFHNYNQILAERTSLLNQHKEAQETYFTLQKEYEKLLSQCPECPVCKRPLQQEVLQ